MKILNLIGIALVVGFWAVVFILLFNLLLKLENGLGWLIDRVTAPIRRLVDLITPAWGGILLMIGITLYSAWYVAQVFLTAADFRDPLLTIATGTTFGSVIYLFATQFDMSGYLNYGAPIAVAFGSFFAYVYMRFTIVKLEVSHMNRVLRWILLVITNVIFIAFSCLLSEDMSILFSKAALWFNTHMVQLYDRISQTQIDSANELFSLIGNVLKMLPIAFAAAVILLITVREYLASALYGAASFLFTILIGLLVSWIFGQLLQIPVFVDPLVICAMFFIDYIRADGKANERFRNLFAKLSRRIFRSLFGFFLK